MHVCYIILKLISFSIIINYWDACQTQEKSLLIVAHEMSLVGFRYLSTCKNSVMA
jgi:hypothetical protein